MVFRTLISTEALASHLAEPEYVVVDCRFKLDDTSWGEQAYRAAHIPGAAYVHLDRDLSGVKNGRNGRHPLPDSRVLAETLGRLGVTAGTQVVTYDQDGGMFASRLWWLLRWMGHEAAAFPQRARTRVFRPRLSWAGLRRSILRIRRPERPRSRAPSSGAATTVDSRTCRRPDRR